MKKTLFIIAAVAAFALVSCDKDNTQEYSRVDLTFKAVLADNLDTKTELDPNDSTKVLWSVDDYFRLYSGTMQGVFYSMEGYVQRECEIRGGMVPISGDTGTLSGTYWAVYPNDNAAGVSNNEQYCSVRLPSSQQGKDDSFGNNLAPMVACTNSLVLNFYNVCGGVMFKVTEPGIMSVRFGSIKGDEPLAGRVTVEMVNGRPNIVKVDDPSYTVTVTAPEGGFVPGKRYYAMMIPGVLSQGISAVLMKPGSTAHYKLEKPLTVLRSHFGRIPDIDKGLWKVADPTKIEAVDLGLSVLWASANLGAESPEEFGNYYAWGETAVKDTLYTWGNYKWGTQYALTKYCNNSNNGTVDYKSYLDSDDDAAKAVLGDEWSTPSPMNWYDLVYNCNWEKTMMNGVEGYKVSGKMAGYTDKFIFLPCTGYWESYMSAMATEGYITSYSGTGGRYMTSSLGYDSANAQSYQFRSYVGTDNYVMESYSSSSRCSGYSVRAVKSKTAYPMP